MASDLIRALLIEDDPDDVLLVKESLADITSAKIKLSYTGRLSRGLIKNLCESLKPTKGVSEGIIIEDSFRQRKYSSRICVTIRSTDLAVFLSLWLMSLSW